MTTLDHNKFSWQQATSNSDGKSSASGVLGLLGGIAGVLGFISGIIYAFIYKDIIMMTVSIGFFTSSGTLLAVRRWKDGKSTDSSQDNQVSDK